MSTSPKRCVVYSISILASVRVSRTGDRIEELAAYPDMCSRLERLRRRDVRLGVRIDPERIPRAEVVDALRRAGLLGYLDPDLLLIGSGNPLSPFGSAAGPVPAPGVGGTCTEGRLVIVDADADERSRIRRAGLLSAPHQDLVDAVLKNEAPLRFLGVRVQPPLAGPDWRMRLRAEPLVPLYVPPWPADGESLVLYTISDEKTAGRLNGPGLEVELLGEPDEPQWTDVHMVTNLEEEDARSHRAGANELARVPEGILVKVPAADPELPGIIPPRHFHSRKLIPSTGLLEPGLPLGPSPLPSAFGQGVRLLSDEERETIRQLVTPDSIRRDVDRYSGAAPLSNGVTIVSRELEHCHNRIAVCSLADDLARLEGGRLSVKLHPFKNANVQCANVEATLPRSGLGGAVIVCAHLDSTVDPKRPGSQPHDPAIDPAPGADDNASGVAGVLCTAAALLRLASSGAMHREIRFLLFNSEEYGITGSQRYARDRQRMRDDITAVFNMDMIGYDAVAPSFYELHAGGTGTAEVRDRSRELAKLVDAVAPEVCDRTLVAQFHFGLPGTGQASESSDHASFNAAGFPACHITEDFTRDLGRDAPKPDRTPGYHLRTDTVVCPSYAADIARAVAAAAWVAATFR